MGKHARMHGKSIDVPWQVRDATFLFRYNEPVLLVLHEAGLDWAGRARRGGKDGEAPWLLSPSRSLSFCSLLCSKGCKDA